MCMHTVIWPAGPSQLMLSWTLGASEERRKLVFLYYSMYVGSYMRWCLCGVQHINTRRPREMMYYGSCPGLLALSFIGSVVVGSGGIVRTL